MKKQLIENEKSTSPNEPDNEKDAKEAKQARKRVLDQLVVRSGLRAGLAACVHNHNQTLAAPRRRGRAR